MGVKTHLPGETRQLVNSGLDVSIFRYCAIIIGSHPINARSGVEAKAKF
jgi:hypothetical protein